MSTRTKRILIVVAIIQVLITAAIFALPRVVRALPGGYYVTLLEHPLTSGVMELITTPVPENLPAPNAEPSADTLAGVAELPEIPGLPTVQPTNTPTIEPTFTPTHAPTDIPTQEATVAPTNTATPIPTPTGTPTPEPLPASWILEGLNNQKQSFNNCGAANLSVTLNYLGDPTTQEEARLYLKPNPEDRNVSPWQIVDYVNEVNFNSSLVAAAYSGGNEEMLKRFIYNGIPVVIEKGYEPSNGTGWYGHYLTVFGYDDEAEQYHSMDTNLGPFDGRARLDTYQEFDFWWQQFNYTFYIVYLPSQQDIVDSILPDILEDEFTMWQHSAILAEEQIEANPNNEFAWFNLGVSLTQLGKISTNGDNATYYEGGALAFDQAREIGLPTRALYYEHSPFLAYWKVDRLDDVLNLADAMLNTIGGQYVEEIYWYQGHALIAQGNVIGAREAYESALEVNPNFSPARASLDWLIATYYSDDE